jgi:signal transduction histidine kinase
VLRNKELRFANKNPKNYLKNIYINHINAADTVFYDLPHNKNNISISTGFISFNNRNIILRHKIKNSEEDWNYTKATTIDYFSITPGSYVFDMEYSSDYTTWHNINFPRTFKIHPTWWESFYFKIVIILLMAFASYFFFRTRYKRKLLRLEMQNKLRTEKERIARDLHDNIGSKLVSLSLGLDSMAKNNSSNKVASDLLIENVNSTVTELRDTIWVIQKEDITLTEFIDKLDNLVWRLRQQQEDREFQFFVEPVNGFENNKFSPLTAINLFRIIQEVIANSQKHSQATAIQIRLGLDKSNSAMKIAVEDNGVGFDLEKILQNGHYGLANIKLRSAEIGARINIQTDLGKGTTVRVEVDLNNN